jgi:hypothetical protein
VSGEREGECCGPSHSRDTLFSTSPRIPSQRTCSLSSSATSTVSATNIKSNSRPTSTQCARACRARWAAGHAAKESSEWGSTTSVDPPSPPPPDPAAPSPRRRDAPTADLGQTSLHLQTCRCEHERARVLRPASMNFTLRFHSSSSPLVAQDRMADGQVTIHTRKLMRNPLLKRRQMVRRQRPRWGWRALHLHSDGFKKSLRIAGGKHCAVHAGYVPGDGPPLGWTQ